MRVDINGFFLYWIDQNNEIDILDIATIRDVRTGPYARKPKDAKLKQLVTLGSQDTLEEKTITICYGEDFVNITFVNFCCTRKDIAQHWSEGIFRLAHRIVSLNESVGIFLNKAYIKLCLLVDKNSKIPVKNIIKLFATHKDDRKRVEKALDNIGLPSGKIETVSLAKFTFDEFFSLYKNLTQRTDVERVFESIIGKVKRKYMTIQQFVDFLNKTQRDPRLNEILHPYVNTQKAKEIIQQYEPNKFNVQKGLLSLEGFLRYLISSDNPIIAHNKLNLCDDMDQPLSHYFINSSHNTYLIGHQLTGKSSVEIYRQCLLAGCRCVELDFWNGRTEEPVIVHGYTFVPEIFAKDVLEAIAESAFKTSEMPVILSFENHCNPRQQAKIANYCREIFGDMLLDRPFDSHPLEANAELPPPSLLKRKIIIKNKKKHHHHHHHKKSISADNTKTLNSSKSCLTDTNVNVTTTAIVTTTTPTPITASTASTKSLTPKESSSKQRGSSLRDNATLYSTLVNNGDIEIGAASSNGTTHGSIANTMITLQQMRHDSKESIISSDTHSSSEEEFLINTALNLRLDNEAIEEKVQNESEAGAELSALVNYVQPVHFSSFENAEKRSRFYEMSSFDEKQATILLKERPVEFVNYNKHQLSRIYPAGTRFDSSNYMPQLFWNAGCQLVALNYQSLDLAMQLNLGIFEYNGRCGYLLKPEFMRRTDRRFDPFAESTVDGIIAGTVSVTVLSGQFLSDKRVGTYVEVDMFGLPADTVRKKFRTKVVRDNGINPVYDEEAFVFKKVVLPELASIRIAAYEENGKFIGHRILPVVGLCPGYRHLNLRNELGQPLPLSALFLCIVVKDYVPDDLSNFAEALANPIKYQNELDKRDKQLAVLMEGTEPKPEDQDIKYTGGGRKEDLRLAKDITMSPKQRIMKAVAIASIDVTNNDQHTDDEKSTTSQNLPMQHFADANVPMSMKQVEPLQIHFDKELLTAEPLEKILNNKLVLEKCIELQKELKSLRLKHDKEKIKIIRNQLSETESNKKNKFPITNKLVRRLSNKNVNATVDVPPCTQMIAETSDEASVDVPKSKAQQEKLSFSCQGYMCKYQEVQKKYHEVIYTAVEKTMIQSQNQQVKRLKSSLERVTSDMMHQLQEARKCEVKNLAAIHKNKDEFIRMKREVARSVVERGVMERVRLKQTFDKCNDDLLKQHDEIRKELEEHKLMAKNVLENIIISRNCIMNYGILTLFPYFACSTENSTLKHSDNNRFTVSPSRSSKSAASRSISSDVEFPKEL